MDSLDLLFEVLFEGSHEGALLFAGLEATMSELARGIDELEFDLFEAGTRSVDDERLTKDESTLLGTSTAALDHEEVVVHDTVVGEATHGRDGLGGEVKLGGGAGDIVTARKTVDLLVHFCAVVEAVLTGTGYGEHDTSRVPRSDTGDLAKTLVRLAGKFAGSPSLGDTLEALTFGDTDDVDVFILLKE